MKIIRVIGGLLALVLLVGAGFVAYVWRSEIAAVDRPAPETFDAALVRQGAQLAAVGNCNVCHSKPGGEIFAGGLALPTPFGTIYSTNITPDPETGIGRWSQAAFTRSMREGVDREGRHLYPAFPFDHFTKVTDEDNRALYAYLMTRKAVHSETPANQLPFPLNVRMAVAGWKLLFFREGVYENDPAHDAVWNRGAYLAEGLGHCGACHTPRNLLGAEKASEHWAGGEAEGWSAYALNDASPAPIPWTTESLTHYLGKGWEEQHGVARGPMAAVTANMGSVPDADARAMATYVASVMGEPSAERQKRAETVSADATRHAPGVQVQTAGSQSVPPAAPGGDAGAAIYAAACSSCHDAGRPLPYGGLNLRYSTAMYGPTPENPINVILHGLPAAEGEAGPMMPGFSGMLDDAQMAALLTYLRATFSDKPAWDDVPSMVTQIRAGEKDTELRASDGASSAPANPTKRETSW